MAQRESARPAFLAVTAVGLIGVGLAMAALGGLRGATTIAFLGRLVALGGLFAYGAYRRSLTTWILVSMAIGAEIGHDWPAVGVNARVLSLIFLRLIKTIIAPLLFGTLVVGIAGHSNLRQVGRMGVKALVYFEAVTTIALFIGLAAINLTRAGVGVQPPSALPSADVAGRKQTAADVLLHVSSSSVSSSASRSPPSERHDGARCWPSARAFPRRCSSSPTSSCTSPPSEWERPSPTPSAIWAWASWSTSSSCWLLST
jgi:proton glutamate symport protein